MLDESIMKEIDSINADYRKLIELEQIYKEEVLKEFSKLHKIIEKQNNNINRILDIITP